MNIKIAAVLAFIVIAASLLFYKDKSKTETTIAPSPQTATKTPTQNKTYDSQYGFSFEYPSGFVYENFNDKAENILEYVFFNDESPTDYKNYKFSISVDKENIETNTRFLNYGDMGLVSKATTLSAQLKGKKIIKADSSFSQTDPKTGELVEESRSYIVLIPLGEKTLEIYAKAENKKLIEDLLPTLQFE